MRVPTFGTRQTPADAGHIVRAALAALIVLELISVGWLMQYPLQKYRDADRAAAINLATDHLVRASLDFAFERGRTRVLLSRDPPVEQTDTDFIALRRERADAELALGLAALPDDRSPAFLDQVAALRARHAAVALLRRENDAAVAQPLSARKPQLADHWFETVSQLMIDIEDLMNTTVLDPAVREAEVHELLEIKVSALRMRDAAGAESSYLGNALSRGVALEPHERDRILALRVRASLAWDEVLRRTAAVNVPSISAAVDTVRTEYVERFGALRHRVLPSMASGVLHTMSPAEYSARSVPSLDSIRTLFTATAVLADDRVRAGQRDARVAMAFHILLALGAAALVIWLARFVYRDFRVPLERLNRTLAGGEIALWDANVSSGTVHLSKEWSMLLGNAPREIDTTVSALKKEIHPDDRRQVLHVARKAVTDFAHSYRVEHRVKDAGGRWMWIRSEGRVVELDGKGRAKRIAGMNIRIDDRKRAEEALRAERERYRKLIEQMPDAIFINRGELIGYANPAALRLLGARTTRQIVGSSIFRFLHPDDHAVVREHIAGAALGRESTGFFERRYVRLDGTVIDLEMSGVQIVDETGPARLIVARDISARARTERERREMRVFLDSLVENIPHMIFVKDAADLRVVRANRAAEDMLGLDRGELLGKTDYDMFPRDQAESFTACDRAVLQGKAMTDVPEEPVQTRSRGLRYLHTKKIPLLDANDHPRYLLGISEDITERKQSSEALRRMNDTLSERANQLTAANRQLESFSYSVSHDLRAPLRHIASFALLLEQRCADRLDANAHRYLKQIGDAVQRMSNLIDGLLEFARSGQGELARLSVDLGAIVREVVNETDMQVAPRHIDWEIGALPAVCGDPGLLRVVFGNLIDNAVKYTGKRENAKIEIATIDGDGSEHVVYVRDNGVGFDPAYTDKLFAVFQRLHSDYDFPGTGVGLASVQQIVRRHGGRVWAESKLDRGATFFVALPASTSAFANA